MTEEVCDDQLRQLIELIVDNCAKKFLGEKSTQGLGLSDRKHSPELWACVAAGLGADWEKAKQIVNVPEDKRSQYYASLNRNHVLQQAQKIDSHKAKEIMNKSKPKVAFH